MQPRRGPATVSGSEGARREASHWGESPGKVPPLRYSASQETCLRRERLRGEVHERTTPQRGRHGRARARSARRGCRTGLRLARQGDDPGRGPGRNCDPDHYARDRCAADRVGRRRRAQPHRAIGADACSRCCGGRRVVRHLQLVRSLQRLLRERFPDAVPAPLHRLLAARAERPGLGRGIRGHRRPRRRPRRRDRHRFHGCKRAAAARRLAVGDNRPRRDVLHHQGVELRHDRRGVAIARGRCAS